VKKLFASALAGLALIASVVTPAQANVENPLLDNARHATSFSWHTPANQFYAETVLTCTSKTTADAVTKFHPVKHLNYDGLNVLEDRIAVQFEFMQTSSNGFKLWYSIQDRQGEIAWDDLYYTLDLGNGDFQLELAPNHKPVELTLTITNPSGHISTEDVRGNVLLEDANGQTQKIQPFRIKLDKRFGVNCKAF
jgi:hypothetical protein